MKKLKKKRPKITERIPVAPPTIRHKSKKDYDRQKDKIKLKKEIIEKKTEE